MTEWDQMGIPVISTSHKTHLDMVDQGNYAYLIDETSAQLLQQKSCDFKTMNSHLPYAFLGMGFQENSAYVKHASKM